MERKNEENLNELLGAFMPEEQAESAFEDFEFMREHFEQNPGPRPGSEVLARVERSVGEEIDRVARFKVRRIVYKAVSVAALIIVVSALSFIGRVDNSGVPLVSNNVEVSAAGVNVWESENVEDSDTTLLTIEAEINQIEAEIASLGNGSSDVGYENDLIDLENEIIEIKSDFWKG